MITYIIMRSKTYPKNPHSLIAVSNITILNTTANRYRRVRMLIFKSPVICLLSARPGDYVDRLYRKLLTNGLAYERIVSVRSASLQPTREMPRPRKLKAREIKAGIEPKIPLHGGR